MEGAAAFFGGSMEKELILMVGPIGAGKSTLAKQLLDDKSIRISQDEMGRKAYLTHFKQALREEVPRIIIDRMNFNKKQRKRFIEPAREAGYCITIFEFKTNRAICFERVVTRKNHPTIPPDDHQLTGRILDMYYVEYESLDADEYDNYNEVKDEG